VIEIERKFLVTRVLDGRVRTDGKTKAIVQVYLTPEEGFTSERLRVEIGLDYKLWHTRKRKIATGTHDETTVEVSTRQHEEELMQRRIPGSDTIVKTRHVFDYDGQCFELDYFHGHLDGLMVLEIELPSIDTDVRLPPFLVIEKEVTNDVRYSNAALAQHGLPTDNPRTHADNPRTHEESPRTYEKESDAS
jgi:CYTH domain-containing protein